jgi:hypothetical protein
MPFQSFDCENIVALVCEVTIRSTTMNREPMTTTKYDTVRGKHIQFKVKLKLRWARRNTKARETVARNIDHILKRQISHRHSHHDESDELLTFAHRTYRSMTLLTHEVSLSHICIRPLRQ